MTKLLPCPFCGAEPYIDVDHFNKVYVDKNELEDWVMQKSYQVKCRWCMTKGPNWFETEEEAAEAWNTRHQETCGFYQKDGSDFDEYYCNRCHKGKFSSKDKFCPNCGLKIEFPDFENVSCDNV